MRATQVAVVGGGPAGIAAALAAAGAGARVTLIDEQPSLGGHLRWQVSPVVGLEGDLDGLPGARLAGALAARVGEAGVEVVSGAVAWGLFEGHVLGVLAADRSYQLRSEAVVVASGTTDAAAPFPGWTLPGVMTARAARICLNLWRVLPGRRFAVVGAGDDADEVAREVALAGAEVVVRVEDPGPVAVEGERGVERLLVGEEAHAVDVVVLALGRRPDPELALQAQVTLGYDPALGTHLPLRSETLETSVPGLYVAGEAAGAGSVAEALAEGRLAGLSAAGAAVAAVAEARERLAALRGRGRGAAAEGAVVVPEPGGVWGCRCEEVSLAAIREAIAAGALTVNDVKRRTRAGMGACQGIYCTGLIARLIHEEAGVPLADLAPMTERPPARLIPLDRLAALEE